MARLTLAEFLGTYPAEREFVPSLGPSTTVGAFFDRLSAEEKALEVTYRGNEEGVFVFIDGLESARLGRVSWPAETTEPPTVYQEPEEYTRARFWAMAFSEKVNSAEHHYHSWQIAQETARRDKGRDAELHTVLLANASEKHRQYNGARAELYAWVVAHPAPEGAAELD